MRGSSSLELDTVFHYSSVVLPLLEDILSFICSCNIQTDKCSPMIDSGQPGEQALRSEGSLKCPMMVEHG